MADKKKIWLSPPFINGNEKKYVNKAFDSNWIAPTGPYVDQFEKDICKLTNSKFAIACSSGTAGIHLGLKRLGVQKGDYVACQTFTFAASAFPIFYENAKAVFIDSEKDSWNMSPELLETAIKKLAKKGIQLKAIIVVHLFGMPAKIVEIKRIAKKYKIPILEDAAEALGSTYNGKHLGLFGDIGVYSFNGNKIITCSNGGMIVSNNSKFENRIRKLANQANEPNKGFYHHKEIGYNYRLSNILAGLGCAQLESLDEIIERKRTIFKYYKKNLCNVEFQLECKKSFSNYWLTTIVFDTNKRRNKVFKRLRKANIDARLPWKPMHLQPVFKKQLFFNNGISKDIFDKGICLPSGAQLKKKELKEICSLVNSF